MPSTDDFRDEAAEQVASALDEGLRSCRTLVDDYRAKLIGYPAAANSNEQDPSREQLSG